MSRIDDIFQSLSPLGMKALMPFLCGGHPRPGMLGDLILACEAGGASIIEVGIPFSDPIADGPVIAGAMHQALQAGATPASVMDEVREVRGRTGAGLVAMVSVSIVHRMGGGTNGAEGFAQRAKDAGFDGLIVPDVPLEESEAIRKACKARDLSCSMLISPTTPPPRAAEIAKACSGFIYLMARTGITGESGGAPDVAARVAQLRQATTLPIAVGFGIGTPEHVTAAVKDADAAIVGSALVRRISEAHATRRDPALACRQFVENLALGLMGNQTPNDPRRRL